VSFLQIMAGDSVQLHYLCNVCVDDFFLVCVLWGLCAMQVTHIDGQKIPVGIAGASARVRRIQEMIGNTQRLVEITVSRQNAWGAGTRSISHIHIQSVAANLDSSSDDDWVVSLKRAAIHCSTLQHTATHCNTGCEPPFE